MAKQRKLKKQKQLLQQIYGYISLSSQELKKIKQSIQDASDNLTVAEVEFKNRAYIPYWEAIEHAVNHLTWADNGLKKIHNFHTKHKVDSIHLNTSPPPFTLDLNTLPDGRIQARRMKSIVRLGQTDPEFTQVFLQMRTNQILLKGFENINQTIDQMGNKLNQSLTILSRDLGKLQHLQEKTIDGQNEIKSLQIGQLSTLEGIREGMEDQAEWAHQEAERQHEERLEDAKQSDQEIERQIENDEKTLEILDNIQRRQKPKDSWLD